MRFNSARGIMRSQIGWRLPFKKLADTDETWDTDPTAENTQAYKNAYDAFVAMLFLENADRNKYGTLITGLATQYSLCLLYTSPSPRDQRGSRMPSSA